MVISAIKAPSLPPGPRMPGPAQAVLWGLRYPQFTGRGHERFGATFTVKPGTMPPLVLTSDRDAIRRLLTGDPLTRHHGNDAVRPLIGEGVVQPAVAINVSDRNAAAIVGLSHAEFS